MCACSTSNSSRSFAFTAACTRCHNSSFCSSCSPHWSGCSANAISRASCLIRTSRFAFSTDDSVAPSSSFDSNPTARIASRTRSRSISNTNASPGNPSSDAKVARTSRCKSRNGTFASTALRITPRYSNRKSRNACSNASHTFSRSSSARRCASACSRSRSSNACCSSSVSGSSGVAISRS